MKNGWLSFILILSLTVWAAAQERVLHNFGEGQDGASPWSGVTLRNNRLYGTTLAGGAFRYGTVYEMQPAGTGWRASVGHDFSPGTDGYTPQGRVVFDNSGNMYGTTPRGGAYDQGAIFMMSRTAGGWSETLLYSFTGANDGAWPTPHLEIDGTGNLYGATILGGTSGNGTVFKLSPANGAWIQSTLYSFGLSTGARPWAGVLYRDGAFYGTTSTGGAHGWGTVFALKPNGPSWSYQVLHDFTGTDGGFPKSGVVLSKGNLYGTTSMGGSHDCGTVFALSVSSGALQVFSLGGTPDGCTPNSGVILDWQNNLYGTTTAGGASNAGVVFKQSLVGSTWTETLLHSFTGGSDGGGPVYDSLTFRGTNKLLGTTSGGGSHGLGVVFELVP